MSKGWISLHRELQDHWLWKDKPFSKGQAWIDLLLTANHKPNKFLLGNELIEMDRGQIITSELKLMDRWGWSKTKLRNFLETCEKDSMIVKVSDKKKTTLTIVNYSDWQERETIEKPQEDQKETTERPQEDTNNNDNNDNNDNKNIHVEDSSDEETPPVEEPPRYDESSPYYQAALYIRKKVLEINPKARVPADNPSKLEKWANDVRLTIEADKRTFDEMKQVIKYVFKDDFWSVTVQSPSGLRKHWDKVYPKINKTTSNKGNMSYQEQIDKMKDW